MIASAAAFKRCFGTSRSGAAQTPKFLDLTLHLGQVLRRQPVCVLAGVLGVFGQMEQRLDVLDVEAEVAALANE